MGIVYCGPFAAEIDEGTRYGHEGYAVQVLADSNESRYLVREFREYRAGCGCGWRSSVVHPPTDAGETAAEDEWDDHHLRPLIRAVAAWRVVPVSALLDLIAELRRDLVVAEDARPEDGLTERQIGRCDVIETLKARLEDLAVERPDDRPSRPTGSAW